MLTCGWRVVQPMERAHRTSSDASQDAAFRQDSSVTEVTSVVTTRTNATAVSSNSITLTVQLDHVSSLIH